eukprot:scaffold24557_cov74-Phaeocystis_antarctica.AAC.3
MCALGGRQRLAADVGGPAEEEAVLRVRVVGVELEQQRGAGRGEGGGQLGTTHRAVQLVQSREGAVVDAQLVEVVLDVEARERECERGHVALLRPDQPAQLLVDRVVGAGRRAIGAEAARRVEHVGALAIAQVPVARLGVARAITLAVAEHRVAAPCRARPRLATSAAVPVALLVHAREVARQVLPPLLGAVERAQAGWRRERCPPQHEAALSDARVRVEADEQRVPAAVEAKLRHRLGVVQARQAPGVVQRRCELVQWRCGGRAAVVYAQPVEARLDIEAFEGERQALAGLRLDEPAAAHVVVVVCRHRAVGRVPDDAVRRRDTRLALAVVGVEAAVLVVALGVAVPVVHLALAAAARRVAQLGARLALPVARGVEAGVVALIVGLLRWVAPGGTPTVGQRGAKRAGPCEGEAGRAIRVIADEQHEHRAARGGDGSREGAAAQAAARRELDRSGGATVVDDKLVVPVLGAELLEG